MRQKSSALVQKVWNYAHVLKDDGLAFMDYTEQITYLLFLKMAWEQRENGSGIIPARYSWGTLKSIDDDRRRLERYHQGLRKLSELPGLIGLIFTKPQSKINDPAKLHLLIQMIDGEDWSGLDLDVKGEVYEGLLARNADDVRGGAGQYFTPRAVVRAIVEVMRPTATMVISDPACGTGGFLLAAYEFLKNSTKHGKNLAVFQRSGIRGTDLVSNVARLCAMNLFLHGIGADADRPVVQIGDSLEEKQDQVDMVLTNPPFGKKSSFVIVGADGKAQSDKLAYHRPDFWATTSNKQLNFVQHIYTMLKDGGSAAVVVPDNVLFEGGAGEVIRRELLRRCNVHTILRLPTGIWYSPGVKANVLFFEKDKRGTRDVWVYDLRSNQKFSVKQKQISSEDLRDFVASYATSKRSDRQETPSFRRFTIEAVMKRERANLDLQWQHDASAISNASDPSALVKEILADLDEAMKEFASLNALLKR